MSFLKISQSCWHFSFLSLIFDMSETGATSIEKLWKSSTSHHSSMIVAPCSLVSDPVAVSTTWLEHRNTSPFQEPTTEHRWSDRTWAKAHRRVCSPLKLQPASRASPPTWRKSKVDTNTKSRHITEENLLSNKRHCHALFCHVHIHESLRRCPPIMGLQSPGTPPSGSFVILLAPVLGRCQLCFLRAPAHETPEDFSAISS